MASFLIFSLLLLTFSTTTTLSLLSPSPSSSPSSNSLFSLLPQPPPTHPQDSPQQLQFNSIIDSIVGAGDFSNWANLLSQTDPSTFPIAATFFIPDDEAFLAGNSPPSPESPVNFIDPLLFPYHIIPRRFSFSELRQFPSGARLPTLLPGKTLLITNNSAGNFSINGAFLSHPDLFLSAIVSVHGIASVLQYNLFGSDNSSSPENSPEISPLPEFSLSPEIEFTELERGPVSEYVKSDGNFVSKRFFRMMLLLLLVDIVQDCIVILFVDSIIRNVFKLM
ncbi:FAS1 domain-containing protein SELMODRAFT_448915 [Beta vulgaris subsp. vulgaris]|uniref:FAS1 domain-containing protein SELMODRAFT_448915 n=1 Tax=Beta vulgaris subsp. vulgaris TaxID=3555 RepID=UPI0020366BC4|nr:FAS1 domain-containing protein SELMODRAFT_448915 [Beta vulgaris subsp. vulgaris]